jgi:molybdenum cofactor cytidylyltransferase
MRVVKAAAVVLAAGASRRLGEPKQLVRLSGETLVERAVRICREAGCNPVVVVLGASSDEIQRQCSFEDAKILVNEEWTEGMGSSVRAGIRALDGDVDGCVVVTCDMPAISTEHLHELMKTGEKTASTYAGRRGVPAFFPRSSFAQLMKLRGDTGARDLLKDAGTVELEGGEIDLDTADDLARVRELFGEAPSV